MSRREELGGKRRARPVEAADGKGLTELSPSMVRQIDRALAEMGPFGEVRISKAEGRIRTIQTLERRSLSSADSERGGTGWRMDRGLEVGSRG